MPATAREYGADPTDPRQNVEPARDICVTCCSYRKQRPPGEPRPRRLQCRPRERWTRHHGVPPYRETLAYVGRVLRKYEKQSRVAKAAKPLGD